MENECTSHIFGLFAIFLPKIIKIGGNLTKFWQKQICLVFSGTRCISSNCYDQRDHLNRHTTVTDRQRKFSGNRPTGEGGAFAGRRLRCASSTPAVCCCFFNSSILFVYRFVVGHDKRRSGADLRIPSPLVRFNHVTDPHSVTFFSSLYTTIRNPNPNLTLILTLTLALTLILTVTTQ